MRVANEDLLDESGPLNLATSQTLRPIWLGHIANYAIQLQFTGTPGGNFKLQASNEAGRIGVAAGDVPPADITVWTDVADSAATVSAAGDIMWTVESAGYTWVRVVWTQTSSSGTLTFARAYVKGV